MTVGLPPAQPAWADATAPRTAPEYAGWGVRFVAMLLDLAIVSFATWLIAGDVPILSPAPGWAPTTNGLTWPDAGTLQWWALAILYSGMVCLQAYTGATPGKAALGIRVVGETGGRPVGILRTVVRWFAHFLDAILFVGYLRPLWHARRQTFADSLLCTVVVHATPRRFGPWRIAALVAGLAAGALSFVSGGGASSTAVATDASCTAPDGTRVTASYGREARWSSRGFIRRDAPTTWSVDIDLRGFAPGTQGIDLGVGERVWNAWFDGDAGSATAGDVTTEYDRMSAEPWATIHLTGLDDAAIAGPLQVTRLDSSGTQDVLCTLPRVDAGTD
ncbi:RDD family protein [Microbacterium rhizophilus]|uniref:RDD family protein n=1 Tax=Microbacterium rhizophilus TaxID=3138934 RepID=UPI0031EA6FE2